MKGSILEFNVQRSEGVISGDDGKRYAFAAAEWQTEGTPRVGQKVDFVQADGVSARAVYAAVGSTSGAGDMSGSMKKAIIAIVCAVLAFFIPVIGLVLSIVGLLLGRQARITAKAEAEDTAAMVALIAIIVAAISLAFAAIALLSLVFMGSGLAILGAGGVF
ncbi:hypothetical protein ACSSV8_003996 [Roseovarius sp. MBR-79]|jgi:hypothetical protein